MWAQKPFEAPKAKAEMNIQMLYGEFKDTWDMCLIEVSMELKKWNQIQKDGSTAPDKTKIAKGLTEECVEEALLKGKFSFFMKFAARK